MSCQSSPLKYAVASFVNQSDQLACILDNSFASGRLLPLKGGGEGEREGKELGWEGGSGDGYIEA